VPLVTKTDGRRLHYEVSRAVRPEEAVLVFHHGTPGAAVLWADLVSAADRHAWPVVMCSRPGYASSDRRLDRQVVDVAGDVESVLDELGAGGFVTAGWSGGGPHALACGARMSGRCAAVATIAGVAPYGADGLDWMAGMGPENIEEFGLAVARDDPKLRAMLEVMASECRQVTVDGVADLFGGLLSQPDREVLTGPFAAWVAAWLQASMVPGYAGMYDDDMAFTQEWGFDLGAFSVPVTVWVAAQDLMVPSAHGEWLATHIAGAGKVSLPEDGHLTLLASHIGDVVDRLALDAGPL
jgi:pimeloyl-ACP methyl ester carboxylesterase